MKLKEIYKKNDIESLYDFEEYVKENYKYKAGFGGIDIPDDEVDEVVKAYQAVYAQKNAEKLAAKEAKRLEEEKKRENELAEEKQKRERELAEERRKSQILSEMLITSGFTFDGYRIVKYSGYISGDDAVTIPRQGFFSFHDNCQNLTDALAKIRRQALKELKEAAYNLGCNAVIGVDFDYLTLEPEHGSGLLNGASGAGTVYEPYVICVTANGNAVIIEKAAD